MYDTGAAAGPAISPATDEAGPSADVWRRTADGLSRTVSIDRSWLSWGGVHGGHVASLGLEAMAAAIGDLRPVRALSIAFLTAVTEQPLVLAPTVERIGGSTSVASLRATQESETVMFAMATFGAPGPGPIYHGTPAPDVPPPDACPTMPLPQGPVPFAQHLEIRPATADRVLSGGERAELTAWLRFADRRTVDAAGVTVLLDALAPGLFATITVPIPMPSVQLSIEYTEALAGDPVDGWVLVQIRTDNAAGGWVTDDSAAWSADGRLLAQARQVRRVLTRRT
jgi:acyl-CoA thioesterase